jgi:LysR family hydrogen peroxide-inducible transcriptional activator
MVASGLGISVLPYSALKGRYQSPLIRAIPFCEPSPSRQVALVWRSSFARVTAIDAVAVAVGKLMV